MPRKKLVRNRVLPYHTNSRSNNREPFPLPLAELWKIMEAEAWSIRILYGAEIHALLLMPNHYHMILTAPEYDLGEVMKAFQSNVTRLANRVAGRTGHFFGGPYHWSLIQGTRYFGHAYKYLYRNPVKARLCESVEDWPYNTLQGALGFSKLGFPLNFTRVGMEIGLPLQDSNKYLEWLNRPFPKEAELLIQRGLRKRVFDDLRNGVTRKPFPILSDLL